jgi:hypothetical protein
MLFLPTDCEVSPEEGVIRQAMDGLVSDGSEFGDAAIDDLFIWDRDGEVVVSLGLRVIGQHTSARDALIEASHQLFCLSRKVEAAAKRMK